MPAIRAASVKRRSRRRSVPEVHLTRAVFKSIRSIRTTATVAALTVLAGAFVVASPSTSAAHASTTADVTSRPDVVSAMLAAKESGHRVRITGDDTASSTTFANPNGSLTTEQAAGPVRVQNSDGTWSPLDLDLARNPDGGFSTVATPAGLTMSGGGDKALATLRDGLGREFGVKWASTLPAPSVKGGTASYRLNAMTQLMVSATASGFTTRVVLSAPPKRNASFTLPLQLKGLTASKLDDGSLEVSDSASGARSWRSSPFVMWDAQSDTAGNPSNVRPVSFTMGSTAAGQREIDLSPAMSFLTDPSTVYPVTIDPDVAYATALGDTYVYGDGTTGNTTSEWGDYKLPVGLFSSVTYTSYLDFDMSPYAGKHVLSASLGLLAYQSNNATCKGSEPIELYPATSLPDSSTVYANAPGYDTSATYTATGSITLPCSGIGFSSAVDVTKMTQGWAAGTIPSDGIAVVAGDTTSNGGMTFCSMDLAAGTSCSTASSEPMLTVTYRSYPGVPTALSVSPSTMGDNGILQVAATAPTLTATPQDADGGSVQLDIEVDYDPAYYTNGYPGGGTGVVDQQTMYANAGSPSSYQMQGYGLGLEQGDRLVWKARTEREGDFSPWSAPQQFQIDTARPPLPTVACPFAPNAWTSTTGACSLSDSSTDVVGFVYDFDTPTPGTYVDVDAGANAISTSLPDGWHTLDVQAINAAGVYSGLKQIGFGVGVGGLSTPLDQQSTQGAVQLSGGAKPSEIQFTYNYRIGTTGAWQPIPHSAITYTASGSSPTWPVTISNGAVPDMTWNVAATNPADGPVQVQGCYNRLDPVTMRAVLDGCSTATTVLLDRTSFTGVRETEPLGPGQLAPGTGDYMVSVTDATIDSPYGSLSFGRTLTTLSPATSTAGATGVLGPAWRLSLPGPDYTGAPNLTPGSTLGAGYATLTDEVGATYTYKTTDASYPYTFNGLGEAADGSVLTEPDPTTFTLTDADGTVTSWTMNSSSDWVLSKITEPGKHATTYTFEPARVSRHSHLGLTTGVWAA
jgi:hypothetical protein